MRSVDDVRETGLRRESREQNPRVSRGVSDVEWTGVTKSSTAPSSSARDAAR